VWINPRREPLGAISSCGRSRPAPARRTLDGRSTRRTAAAQATLLGRRAPALPLENRVDERRQRVIDVGAIDENG